MLCSPYIKPARPAVFDCPRQGLALPGAGSYLSPAPQAVPQAAGFTSGLPGAPQAVPQAAGLSDAPQAEPFQLERSESAIVVYLQYVCRTFPFANSY